MRAWSLGFFFWGGGGGGGVRSKGSYKLEWFRAEEPIGQDFFHLQGWASDGIRWCGAIGSGWRGCFQGSRGVVKDLGG